MTKLGRRIAAMRKENQRMLFEFLKDHRHDLAASDEPDIWSSFLQVARLGGFDAVEVAELSGAPIAHVHQWYEGALLKLPLYRDRLVAKMFQRLTTVNE